MSEKVKDAILIIFSPPQFNEGIKIVSYPESGGEVKQDATTGETNTKPAVYLTTNAEGRPSGEAFVEVDSEADLEEALKLNNNLMGQRYIEIFRSDTQQLKQHTQESMNNASNWSEPVLRLRGLPYGCTKADIETFFQGNCFRKLNERLFNLNSSN